MKKAIAILLLTGLMAGLLWGCGGQKEISIPNVIVDLQAPENRVQVSETEESWVTDASGNRLSDSQWLLNSKFSKQYIQSLGVGIYAFTYESQSQKGSFTLTVTDSQAPAYQFVGTVPETVPYLSSVTLPQLMKSQDSYQADCQITYALKRGEESIALADGFATPALTEGNYTWTATAVKDGEAFDFTQSFHVQSFQEYLQERAGELLFDEQKDAYLSPKDGVFTVDTTGNTGDYFYTVSASVLETAMTAGKETVTVVFKTDKPLAGDRDGSIWFSNNWMGYAVGIQGADEFRLDRMGQDQSVRYVTSMVREGDRYVYTATAPLDAAVFTVAQPLTLQFNYAKCVAEISISFE